MKQVFIFLLLTTASPSYLLAGEISQEVAEIKNKSKGLKISETKQVKLNNLEDETVITDTKELLNDNQAKSVLDEQSDQVEFVPVTIEHPLFKVFGINPADYLIFYKHRKQVDTNEQLYLDPIDQEQIKETLRITKKRDSNPPVTHPEPSCALNTENRCKSSTKGVSS